MKLNMRMILNRLTGYEVVSHISGTLERNISGPLPFSAPGYLYIRESAGGIRCSIDDEFFVIGNVTVDECFLAVQSIFSWYDDWISKVELSLTNQNFYEFARLCTLALENPVMLQDSSYRLLAMELAGADPEQIPSWKYIRTNGQISVEDYRAMAAAVSDPVARYDDNIRRFAVTQQNVALTGLHCFIRRRSREFGKLTVLEWNRPLNQGDVAVLRMLAARASMTFSAAGTIQNVRINEQFMEDLLESRPVPEKLVTYHRTLILGSTEIEKITLFVIRFLPGTEDVNALQLLRNDLMQCFPSVYNFVYSGMLLAITAVSRADVLGMQILEKLKESKQLQIGVSLPFRDLRKIPSFYAQAMYALNRKQGCGVARFYDWGREYLLTVSQPDQRFQACEPMCRYLWSQGQEKQDYLRSLAAYLEHERSVGRAAEQLYIHRNTLNYRIRCLKEWTGWDLEDPVLRDYLRLSIFYLEHNS